MKKFAGQVIGWVFKKGPLGLGYYVDDGTALRAVVEESRIVDCDTRVGGVHSTAQPVLPVLPSPDTQRLLQRPVAVRQLVRLRALSFALQEFSAVARKAGTEEEDRLRWAQP